MYTVLTGAKVNIGDFLITDNCKKLLRHFRPEHDLFELPSWQPLEPHLDIINQGSAVVIMGGPGFQRSFYPNIYKLTKNINDIKVPIVPMGLGWKALPGDYKSLMSFRFTSAALKVLKNISGKVPYISCRDYMTKEVLLRNGIENVLMTGCPVWYDLNSISKPMRRPEKIEKMVFTPAQLHIYQKQTVDIMKMLARLLPKAERYCSFHRGITADNEYTVMSDQKNNLEIKRHAEILGYKVVDASFNLKKISFYDECDLHVGYRVHAHLRFLSKRTPSILLHEDVRGCGVSESLNILGVDASRRTIFSEAAIKTKVNLISRLVKKAGIEIEVDDSAVTRLESYLCNEVENNFLRFSGVPNIIDGHFEVMKKFINSLPK